MTRETLLAGTAQLPRASLSLPRGSGLRAHATPASTFHADDPRPCGARGSACLHGPPPTPPLA